MVPFSARIAEYVASSPLPFSLDFLVFLIALLSRYITSRGMCYSCPKVESENVLSFWLYLINKNCQIKPVRESVKSFCERFTVSKKRDLEFCSVCL